MRPGRRRGRRLWPPTNRLSLPAARSRTLGPRQSARATASEGRRRDGLLGALAMSRCAVQSVCVTLFGFPLRMRWKCYEPATLKVTARGSCRGQVGGRKSQHERLERTHARARKKESTAYEANAPRSSPSVALGSVCGPLDKNPHNAFCYARAISWYFDRRTHTHRLCETPTKRQQAASAAAAMRASAAPQLPRHAHISGARLCGGISTRLRLLRPRSMARALPEEEGQEAPAGSSSRQISESESDVLRIHYLRKDGLYKVRHGECNEMA